MKHEIKDLTIESIEIYDNEYANGIHIEWCANIGWGQCYIYRLKSDESGKYQADTEHMSSNNDRTFLKMLLDKLADTVEVTG